VTATHAQESQFVVGTRGSALARWQTDHVTEALERARRARGQPPISVEVRVITTQGDVSLAERLVGQIEKGFFTAELEAALRGGEIDWAVHSLKDLPTRVPEGLEVAAVLERASPADWLLVRPSAFADRGPRALPLADGARVGTSSLRRDAMLRTYAPTCASLPLRGNVPTRVEKLRAGQYEAVVLAAAGVSRLALPLDDFIVIELDPRAWQPAPGQGAVAVEARARSAPDERVHELLALIDHPPTRRAVGVERSFLRVLEGGCSTPFGCYVEDGRAWLGREQGGAWAATATDLPDAGPVDDAFIQRVLAGLAGAAPPAASSSEENDHGPTLWRRAP
jgi:hydroxymethylbilane synthase